MVGAPRTGRNSRTFQTPCSSIGQLVVCNKNENAVHILDSSVPVHPMDVLKLPKASCDTRRFSGRKSLGLPAVVLSSTKARVRNSPNSPSSRRKIKTPRLRSLVPSPAGIRPPPLVLRHCDARFPSVFRLSFGAAPGKGPGTFDSPSLTCLWRSIRRT